MTSSYSYSRSGRINYIGFDQQSNMMSVSHNNGYMFYRISDILEQSSLLYKGGSMTDLGLSSCLIAERVGSSGLMVLVSQSDTRVIHVYHFTIKQIICRLRFTKSVLAIKINKEKMVVCLEDSIYIYDINTMKSVHDITGIPLNKLGVIDMATNPENALVAYPGSGNSGNVFLFDANKLTSVSSFLAHEGSLSCLKFNQEGNMIASASTRGTIIRVHGVPNGSRLFEFRRGICRCVNIHSLSFSSDSKFLASSSNTETVHVFKLEEESPEPSPSVDWYKTFKTFSAYMPTQVQQVSNMVTAARCFATARLPEVTKSNRVSFLSHQNQQYVMVATSVGFVYAYRLSPEGGELDMIREVRIGPQSKAYRMFAEIGREPNENDELPPQVHISG
uniref:WD repeat domain phosphoinositide-interacting protein 2 n=1 Tax=Caenorhabditis tropicalis TaxID=1561998 RepID=A0A1I7T8A8_9PELO